MVRPTVVTTMNNRLTYLHMFRGVQGKEKERKGRVFIMHFYTAFSLKVLRHGSHSFTCKLYHACLSFVSIHQIAPPLNVVTKSNCSSLLIYQPREDERLSWPGWLTYSGRLTHISGHHYSSILASRENK